MRLRFLIATAHMSYVHPLEHVEGMRMAYLPNERIVVEADLLDTDEGLPPAPTVMNRALFNQVQRLKHDVATIVPIHGKPVPWTDFVKLMGGN